MYLIYVKTVDKHNKECQVKMSVCPFFSSILYLLKKWSKLPHISLSILECILASI